MLMKVGKSEAGLPIRSWVQNKEAHQQTYRAPIAHASVDVFEAVFLFVASTDLHVYVLGR